MVAEKFEKYLKYCTKLFSVGNTFRQATMQAQIFLYLLRSCAMIWIRLMVKSRPNIKKR